MEALVPLEKMSASKGRGGIRRWTTSNEKNKKDLNFCVCFVCLLFYCGLDEGLLQFKEKTGKCVRIYVGRKKWERD